MDKDLKRIKDKYGENFSHLCRSLFPTLLETEGLLPDLLEDKFYPSNVLYDDIVKNNLISNFQYFINSLVDEAKEMPNVNKTPYELLNLAGYKLYECKTETDIQSFKKYYEHGEELCTFKGGRLRTNYVFFAVKKNVDNIKRKDFTNPTRQDEYGTSVISIQFTKGLNNYVSIKNRYNHTVKNPDSTFNNDLDSIILGLTQSFIQKYNYKICNNDNNFEINNYILADDGKYYKYNYEINNIYYCTDNIIIDNFKPQKFEKDRYIIFDYFILDLKEKKLGLYDDNINDTFTLYNKNIEKVEIRKEKDKKNILLKKGNYQIVIVLDSENKMIAYHNNLILKVGDDFLFMNKYLKAIYLENVRKIGDSFLNSNEILKYIELPLLGTCGNYFIDNNKCLEEVSFPNLEYVGNHFASWNANIKNVDFPVLKEVGCNFMHMGGKVEYLVFPNLIKVGDNFLNNNSRISFFSAPELKEVGSDFLKHNNQLTFLELGKLEIIKDRFLCNNIVLEKLKLSSLQTIGTSYLFFNHSLNKLTVPDDIFDKFIFNTNFEQNFKSKKKILF